MSDKTHPIGAAVTFKASGRYTNINQSGTIVRYENKKNGEWAIVALANNAGERAVRPSTLRSA
ncbi:hypothetical protein CPT_Seuss10 [Caulobacter phage Seuss]|uniref:Uncharacterized protein n=1 Tax=Caulobacter phage Seuss TaxID=1675601 RepID=A0A0K1LM06_9CAUD|nr:hypothetical protein HOR08_gp010 [Caulobacter phage Seuss]AKU43536.1 hypothetical protein CPT_Seuss10 [Caulobacter phage Seuss]